MQLTGQQLLSQGIDSHTELTQSSKKCLCGKFPLVDMLAVAVLGSLFIDCQARDAAAMGNSYVNCEAQAAAVMNAVRSVAVTPTLLYLKLSSVKPISL